jgi:hypothetical protein
VLIHRLLAGLILSSSLGCNLTVHIHLGERPTAPAPVPSPVRPVSAAKHTGHFTVSYIEPVYPSPASTAVRHDLAGVDWGGLDTTFRAYTHGQEQLQTLGFSTLYVAADLPMVFVQETNASGAAPIVPPPLRSPATADVVVARVKELRGTP